MELIFSLALIWALTCTAGALQCQTCTNVTCSSTQSLTCNPNSTCITGFTLVTNSGVQSMQNFKGCVPSNLCTSSIGSYSLQLGNLSTVTSFECCSTDNCNSGTLAAPNTTNGLECFSCATPQCNTPIQCIGVQDRCVQLDATSGSTLTSLFGCTSANLCSLASTFATVPPLQSTGNITIEATCCDTSLCNAVTPETSSDTSCFRPGMILVTLGLFFFTVC